MPTRLRFTGADRPAHQARKLIATHGDTDALRLLDRHLRGTDGPPTVVVVGEVKRGKSTLVNALAGVEVSPTGAEVVTSGTIAVVPPSADLAAGQALVMYGDHSAVVPAGEALRALAPGGEGEPPVGTQVAVESPWVPGLALLDTPGVGGLSSAHARVARRAVAKATALMFVIDGGQTLTAPELDFLREMSEHVEHVLLVLTKIDRNPGGWQEVLEENRAQKVAVANALRVARTGLERVESRAELELSALADPAVTRDLRTEADRHADLEMRQRRAPRDLERDLGRVRAAAVELINERADELTARLANSIRLEPRGMTAAAKGRFESELAAELGLLADEVRGFVGTRLRQLVDEAFGSQEALPAIGLLSAELTDVRTRVRARPVSTLNQLADPTIAMAAVMGATALGPFGLLIAGASLLTRAVRQGQTELAGTLTDSVSGAKADVVAGVDSWLRELRPELHIALDDHLKQSIATVRELIAEAENAAKQDEQTRRSLTNRIALRLDAVRSTRRALDDRLEQLSREHRAPTGHRTVTKLRSTP